MAKRKYTPLKGKPFVKDDVRINRNGRPKSHDELRALIQAIGAEDVDGAGMTCIESKLRAMFASKSAADNSNLLEHGWGKVPQDVKVDATVGVAQITADEMAKARAQAEQFERERFGAGDAGGTKA